MFDTDEVNLPATAISMMELAEAFKTTSAHVVLCILDCCFSGQAPARVLETAARPRNAFALAGVHGEGRILLAACATNEAAWEQPGSGHGLLTYAVIEALTTPSDNPISFPDVVGEIIHIARVEAQRMGVVQTPTFLGTVRGGLVFPVLKRGSNFLAAFTPAAVSKIQGSFAELADNGFPAEIIGEWSVRFPHGPNALQLKAVNDYGVLNGQSLLLVASTSSGKTLVGELAAVQAVTAGKKAAFLLPYRALVNEKFEEFQQRYAQAGFRVVRCSGAAQRLLPVVGGDGPPK